MAIRTPPAGATDNQHSGSSQTPGPRCLAMPTTRPRPRGRHPLQNRRRRRQDRPDTRPPPSTPPPSLPESHPHRNPPPRPPRRPSRRHHLPIRPTRASPGRPSRSPTPRRVPIRVTGWTFTGGNPATSTAAEPHRHLGRGRHLHRDPDRGPQAAARRRCPSKSRSAPPTM